MCMKYKVGDFIVFKKWKASTNPSPRAKDTFPSPHGDYYTYRIDKYWKVVDIIDADTIEVETRRGKRHRISVKTENVRKMNFLDKWLMRRQMAKES